MGGKTLRLIPAFTILLRCMPLEFVNLSRHYGQQKAVDDISFKVHDGEVVGFLGPNGAGKSTSMKVATGFLPPTSGTVLISGRDVRTESISVRRSIGYLPEHNPLYSEMFVHEYLGFCGGIFGLTGTLLKGKVNETIEKCGLVPEQHKKIEALSKGYRQRVGLAQSMLHEPEVLILDEPTSGLDPNQLLEIRNLIKEISRNKTVLFSTHIMQEVQAICDRVVVINKGKIVADDSISNLLKTFSSSRVIIAEFEKAVDPNALLLVKGVTRVRAISDSTYSIESDMDADIRSELFKFSTEKQLSLIGLKVKEQSLESVFKELTREPNPETAQ